MHQNRTLTHRLSILFLSSFLSLQLMLPAFTQQQYPNNKIQGQGQVNQKQYNAQSNTYNASRPEQENVLIILDASYSMIETIDGNRARKGEDTKMVMAKRTILDVLKNVPPHVNVGLRVYGHERNRRMKRSCSATQTLVPIGHNNRAAVGNALLNIKPSGMTPISYSLTQAIQQDFYGLPGKKSVILVSDGMETCSADPCSVAVNMVRQNVDVKINVVGFGLHDLAATRQLKCVALSTFGKFYSVNTSAELADSLKNSLQVETSVEGRILPPSQTPPSKAPKNQKQKY